MPSPPLSPAGPSGPWGPRLSLGGMWPNKAVKWTGAAVPARSGSAHLEGRAAMKGVEAKPRPGACEAYLSTPISLANFLEPVRNYASAVQR